MTHSSLRFRSQPLSDASTDDLTTLNIVKKGSLIWLIKRKRNPRRNAVKSHLENNVNDVLYGTTNPDPTLIELLGSTTYPNDVSERCLRSMSL
jgi:hypothetical protein